MTIIVMAGNILLSTAYMPPVEYISLIRHSSGVLVEREENYIKQSYRNRCYILSANGPMLLSVPALLGHSHKTLMKDIKIDYSKRWQQVHLRAFKTSYSSSPYFEFYFENIEKIISRKFNFLLDLNTALTESILDILSISTSIGFTTEFVPERIHPDDYRYLLNPKKGPLFKSKKYDQVFCPRNKFIANLSVADLIFNMGPESVDYLSYITDPIK